MRNRLDLRHRRGPIRRVLLTHEYSRLSEKKSSNKLRMKAPVRLGFFNKFSNLTYFNIAKQGSILIWISECYSFLTFLQLNSGSLKDLYGTWIDFLKIGGKLTHMGLEKSYMGVKLTYIWLNMTHMGLKPMDQALELTFRTIWTKPSPETITRNHHPKPSQSETMKPSRA